LDKKLLIFVQAKALVNFSAKACMDFLTYHQNRGTQNCHLPDAKTKAYKDFNEVTKDVTIIHVVVMYPATSSKNYKTIEVRDGKLCVVFDSSNAQEYLGGLSKGFKALDIVKSATRYLRSFQNEE
jgi:hypothetical protein